MKLPAWLSGFSCVSAEPVVTALLSVILHKADHHPLPMRGCVGNHGTFLGAALTDGFQWGSGIGGRGSRDEGVGVGGIDERGRDVASAGVQRWHGGRVVEMTVLELGRTDVARLEDFGGAGNEGSGYGVQVWIESEPSGPSWKGLVQIQTEDCPHRDCMSMLVSVPVNR